MTGPTTADLRTPTGVRIAPLVARPDLIRLKVIKKKFIEQMPAVGQGDHAVPPGLEVVGVAEDWVVCRDGENRLVKAAAWRWAKYLAEDSRTEPPMGSTEWDGAYAEANDLINTYPQIFQD